MTFVSSVRPLASAAAAAVALALLPVTASAQVAAPAAAAERESLESLRETTLALIELLVAQGTLTREKADQLLAEARRRAAAKQGGSNAINRSRNCFICAVVFEPTTTTPRLLFRYLASPTHSTTRLTSSSISISFGAAELFLKPLTAIRRTASRRSFEYLLIGKRALPLGSYESLFEIAII
jgi:hypothetical protein